MIECMQIDRGDFVEYWQNETLVHCLFNDGWKIWFNENGVLHNENGPAVIKPDNSQFWYYNGQLHRENFPAIIRANGETEYWILGKRIK